MNKAIGTTGGSVHIQNHIKNYVFLTWVIFYPLIANNVWIKLCFIRLGGLQYVYPKRRSLLSLS